MNSLKNHQKDHCSVFHLFMWLIIILLQYYTCRSGQQILVGDRIVIKAERLGSVCYIGRLDFDPSDTIYIGVHLDLPSNAIPILYYL